MESQNNIEIFKESSTSFPVPERTEEIKTGKFSFLKQVFKNISDTFRNICPFTTSSRSRDISTSPIEFATNCILAGSAVIGGLVGAVATPLLLTASIAVAVSLIWAASFPLGVIATPFAASFCILSLTPTVVVGFFSGAAVASAATGIALGSVIAGGSIVGGVLKSVFQRNTVPA